MICETPLFIRPHSKAVLSKAIHNDSEFLSSHSVMDYSLLVGIDEVNFELVVGIIGKSELNTQFLPSFSMLHSVRIALLS